MPEPGEVSEGLVWTGTAWVPLRPISREGSDSVAGEKQPTPSREDTRADALTIPFSALIVTGLIA